MEKKKPVIRIVCEDGNPMTAQLLIHGEPIPVSRIDIAPIVCDRMVSASIELDDVVNFATEELDLDVCPKHLIVAERSLRTLANLNGFDLVPLVKVASDPSADFDCDVATR